MQFGSGIVHTISKEVTCGGTALFIFISGFLFQHLSYKFEYKNYLFKKWTNVILPYLLTSIPGLVFCFLFPIAYKNAFYGIPFYLQIPMHLTVGRVHNIPTWFIPMIVIFFIFSWALLKLEKKGILYKLLPILFLITIFAPRGEAEYSNIINLSYTERYFTYINYILSGFVHFVSLYVFGMYCSSKKEIIDKFYNFRWLLLALMVLTSIADIWLCTKNIYCNFTISKTFLTMVLLAYLKHYDEFILSHKKTNKTLDFIAKYSFGIFFVHWYWFFIVNQVFNLQDVLPVGEGGILATIFFVFLRFFAVGILSVLSLFVVKCVLLKINKEISTRMFLGI